MCLVRAGSFATRRPRKRNSRCRHNIIIIIITTASLSSRPRRPRAACRRRRPRRSSAHRRPLPLATRSAASSEFRSRRWPPCRCRLPERRRSVRPARAASGYLPAPAAPRPSSEFVTTTTVRMMYCTVQAALQ